MKKIRRAAILGAAVIAAGLVFSGMASAAPAAPAAVSGTTTTATITTPDGSSFHIPVVPYPFSGTLSTTFDLYTLPACSSGAIGYEVFLSVPGVETQFDPAPGSTIILRSDTAGFLLKHLPSGSTAITDPTPSVDFANSGLNGFVTAAGDYSLGVKCFSSTAVTDAWWTEVHFDGAATSTNVPNWNWDPFAGL
jgi:hypothetical protein